MKNLFACLSAIVMLGCQKSVIKEEIPVTPLPPTTGVITVDAGRVIRNLTGTEAGLNVNYLMDDSFLPGQTAQTVTATLQKMGVKFLRYPGGEKSDNYLFSKAPYTRASPVAAYCNFPASDLRFYNTDLTAKQLVLDFDEYMSMCRQLNATPFVVVAYDAMYSTSTCGPIPTREQLLTNAREWVRYANITKGYNVKYWMIGNESWNDPGYNGRVSPSTYAADIAEFADKMRSIDPTIKIVANGRSNDNWWTALLQSSAASKIDYLSGSNYLPQGFTGYDYFRTFEGDLIPEVTAAENALNNASPADKARIGIILSEYNSTEYYNSGWVNENNLGHALCSFQMQADALLHASVLSSCFWNTRWITNLEEPFNIFDALNATGGYNASGTALSALANNLLAFMVQASGTTATLRVYATGNATSKRLNVFFLNKDTAPKDVALNLQQYSSQFDFRKWEFTGKDAADKLPVWNMTGNVAAGKTGMPLKLAANSVTMIEIRNSGGF